MKINTNLAIVLAYTGLILILEYQILLNYSLPLSQDWGWPMFNPREYFWGQITQYGSGLISALGKNALLVFATSGSVVNSSSFLFKIFIFSVHIVAAFSFYRLCKKLTTSQISFIAGLAYALTPYLFVRIIMGFQFSLTAYALLPLFVDIYFLNKKKKPYHYLILGGLLSVIFAQIQAGALVLLILFIHLLISMFNRNIVPNLKKLFLVLLSFFIVNLPWITLALINKNNLSVPGGGSVTTLGRMAAMPHSFKNIFMTSDFEFTSGFFLILASQKLFLLGWLIVWFTAACSIFSKKNRTIVLTFSLASLSVLTLIKGPTGIFGIFYMFVYNHFPQIMVFRDTDHFIFLLAFSLCLCFAVGLDWLWERINLLKLKVESEKLKSAFRTGAKTFFAGSAIFIIAPYLTFDYAGYLPVRRIPDDYNQLYGFLSQNKDYCHKIYYPPGLDFVYFKGDKLPGASNSDSIASSLNVSYVTGGTSILNTPSEDMFYQNELVSQFYQTSDNGEFAALLKEGGVDCVIVREDMDTKYHEAMNLKFEKDSAIIKHWNQNDWKKMAESKQGLKLEKQFGENIYIYKISNSEFQIPNQIPNFNDKMLKTGAPAIKQFSNKTIVSLRLTDWANVNSYYKDGWSRGRYDFWRKLLFTQLRQDFIYTDKSDSLLSGKIDERGDYELWTRSLVGGREGSYQLSVNSYQYTVTKEQGDERFIWQKIGDVKLDGKTDIEIKNISGENAIADLVFVKK